MLNIGNSTRFRLGDKVTVVVDDDCGYGKGYQGTITAIIDYPWIDFDIYEVDGKYEYAEDELELTLPPKIDSFDHSKVESKVPLETEFQNEIPKCNPKSNLEPNDYFKDSFEYGASLMLNSEIIGLKATIASLESELLTVYRELHRINKDSKA